MLTPGQRVDRYTVERLIGWGGIAEVYEVRHVVLGTRHALKVLRGADPGLRERLVREGQLQARLDPRHIVRVTDVVDVLGAPALLMPFVDGCSLGELVEGYRPTEVEIASLVHDVAVGMAVAESAGIVHRDLKPGNVLLEIVHGRVLARIADFGLARGVDSSGPTQSGVFLGTPAYAAPEQWSDASTVDARADRWSLGVLWYELIVGQRPFAGVHLTDLGAAAARGPDLSRIPERWRDTIVALLQVHPDARSTPASAVAALLAPEAANLPADTLMTLEIHRGRGPSLPRRDELAETTGPVTPSGRAPKSDRSLAVLPAADDAFVGRVRELAALRDRLDRGEQLITLLGPGGTGKTRLATEFARRSLSAFDGGAWLCDLSEAVAAPGIAHAVAKTLGVALGKGDDVERLGHAIAGRGRALVILDNFEQVVGHAAATLGRWRGLAPDATFLVTSRQVLGLPGEAVHPLDPLDEEEGISLFQARAARAWSGAPADPTDVGALVRLLDGLPLAIELAAARVRVMPPERMISRMRERFRLLTSTGGRVPRHATLRAAIAWSWDLLSPDEAAALAQLSVFEGGFRLAEAEAVLDVGDASAVDLLQGLVEKSLVRPVGSQRFGMLMSIQEFAAEKLGAGRPEREARHGLAFAAFGSERAIGALDRHGSARLRSELADEIDNLVAACRRAGERRDDAVAVATLCAAWAHLYVNGPFGVGEDLSARVCALPDLEPRLATRADRVRASVLARLGRLGDAEVLAASALARALDLGQRNVALDAHEALAFVHTQQGHVDQAHAHAQASLALARELGDRAAEAGVLNNLATISWARRQLDEAAAGYESASRLAHEVGDVRIAALARLNVGITRRAQGRFDEARASYEAALPMLRAARDRVAEGMLLTASGEVEHRSGNLDLAVSRYESAIVLLRRAGAIRELGTAVGALGQMFNLKRQFDRSRPLLEEATALHRACDFPFGLLQWLGSLALLESESGAHALALAYAEEAVALAAPYVAQRAEVLATVATVRLRRGEAAAAQDAIAAARALDQVGSAKAVVAAVDAWVRAAQGDRAGAEAAIAEATAEPQWSLPGSYVADVLGSARVALGPSPAG